MEAKIKKMIFHIPYKINKERLSGTNLRPTLLREAFEELGYDVEFVSGDGKERKKKIKEIKEKIKNGIKYEFLYSESSTMPTLLTEKNHIPKFVFLDFNFFSFCKKNNIKIGLFYRDIHWNFSQYKVSYFKKKIARIFYIYDLFVYNKLVDILFLPSLKMKDYIPINLKMKIYENFPGSNKEPLKFSEHSKLNLIYIGGTGKLYNYELILETVNNNCDYFNLSITTRKEEYLKNYGEKKIYNKNIRINFSNTKKLDTFDIGILYLEPIAYWEFAVPLKLFDYIALNIPILGVKNTFVGKFIEENDIGWAIEYNKEELEKKLLFLYNNRNEIYKKIEKLKIFREKNTWKERAKQLSEVLETK